MKYVYGDKNKDTIIVDETYKKYKIPKKLLKLYEKISSYNGRVQVVIKNGKIIKLKALKEYYRTCNRCGGNGKISRYSGYWYGDIMDDCSCEHGRKWGTKWIDVEKTA
jgi:hypothetical protein